jgi:hypothetical protein
MSSNCRRVGAHFLFGKMPDGIAVAGFIVVGRNGVNPPM